MPNFSPDLSGTPRISFPRADDCPPEIHPSLWAVLPPERRASLKKAYTDIAASRDHAELEDINGDLVLEHVRSGRYVRDLHYHAAKDLDSEFFGHCERLGGKSALIAAVQDAFYIRYGAQMRVQQEVTDDLLLTDLGEIEFDEIPWPYKAVEMWFEDPTLPTIVLSRAETEELNRMTPDTHFTDVPGHVRITLRMESKDGLILVHNIHAGMWKDLCALGVLPQVAHSAKLDPLEDAAMRYMLMLALKVFAYASLPKYKPEKLAEVTRKMGGKPGLYNRPRRPAVRIVYLPEVHTPRPAETPGASGTPGRRQLRERRGHFRHFRSDYFVHKKGQRLFIPPFKRGDAIISSPTKALVRKPKF